MGAGRLTNLARAPSLRRRAPRRNEPHDGAAKSLERVGAEGQGDLAAGVGAGTLHGLAPRRRDRGPRRRLGVLPVRVEETQRKGQRSPGGLGTSRRTRPIRSVYGGAAARLPDPAGDGPIAVGPAGIRGNVDQRPD